MKKLFTLMFALFAMVAIQAQSFLSEDFENGLPATWLAVDVDEDGYTWEESANPASYFDPDVDLSGSGHGGSNGFVLSGSFSNVLMEALTPDNWLITPAVNLTSNADLTFWICAQDADYAAEHYGVYISTTGTDPANFTLLYEEDLDANGGQRVQGAWKQKTVDLSSYTGQTVYIAFRHFNCTDMFILNIDDVEIFAQPTDPTIVANPATLDFGTVLLGNSNVKQVAVTSYNITNNITATTTAPYEVSADNTTYASTATIPAAGGTLYVRFSPTAEGTAAATVTLSATGATDVTVNVTGEGLDCSASISEFPYAPDFVDGFAEVCWSVNSTTEETWETYAYGGVTYAFVSGLAETEQDEELISPTLDFTNNTNMILMDLEFFASYYWATCTGEDSLTTFTLWASTDGGNSWGDAPIWNVLDEGEFGNYTATNATIDLSNFGGESNVKLKFKYEGALSSSNVWVGNINIYTIDSVYIEADNDEMAFIAVLGNTVQNRTKVRYYNIADGNTATTAAPFAVSTDGTNFSTTVNISNAISTLYVQYTPTAGGTDNGTVVLAGNGAEDYTITLTGTAIDCSTDGTVPFTETFDSYAGELPVCYTFVYADEDPTVNTILNYNLSDDNYVIRFSSYSTTDSAGQYMISPELVYSGSNDMEVSFIAKAHASYGTETFRIGYSTTTNDVDAFTWSEEYTASYTGFNPYYMTIPANAKYAAIHYMSDYQYYLYVDDFAVKVATPVIRVNVDTVDFGVVYLGNEKTELVNVSGVMLENNIAAGVTAPFAISVDDSIYDVTASLAVEGGNLYVKFAPVAEGDFSATITLTSGELSNEVFVRGTGYDCTGTIGELTYTEEFGEEIPVCWTYIDEESFFTGTMEEGSDDYVLAFGEPAMLITPLIEANEEDMKLTFDYITRLPAATYDCEDVFRVGYSSTDMDEDSFTWSEDMTIDYDITDFAQYTQVLPAGTKYVAVEVTEMGYYIDWNTLQFYKNYLIIDNFTIAEAEPEIIANPTDINFGAVQINTTKEETVAIMSAKLTEPITATTTAPFAVSFDGTTFAQTATLTAAEGTLYVQYAPTAVGTHTGTVEITSGEVSATVTLAGSAVDCAIAINQLSWTETFDGTFPPVCWTVESTNAVTWTSNEMTGDTWAYCSYAEDLQDEDLITPLFDFSNYSGRDLRLTFDFMANYRYIHNGDPDEEYNLLVYVSTDGGNTFSSTPVYDMRNDQPEFEDWTETQASVNIASLAGQSNVKIKFNYYGTYGAELLINSVTIDDATGISENVATGVNIYPTPANTVLNVNASSEINTVEIYSLTGAKVATINGNGTNVKVNVADYANGMYFVKIITNDGTTTKKFNVVR